jgi:ankyrin repeat protein
METRRKSARLSGSAQSLIIDALHLFNDKHENLDLGGQPESLTICDLKTALNRAIHKYDLTTVTDLLSTSPFMTRTQPTAENHRDEILDHCLYALHCKLKRTRRAGNADELRYVYRWAHNKDVPFTEESSVLILELLLAAGANPGSVDQNGLTFLHWLAQRREDAGSLRRIADLFINAGCNLEVRDSIYGATPLGWSAWFG